MTLRFEGVITPVITPFHDDFSMDRDGYAQVIEFQIAKGASALVIGGTTGESYALTPEERIAQFHQAQTVIGGRVPWLAGVNDFRTEDVCGLAEKAKATGADGLLLASPPYSVPSGAEIAVHAKAVAAVGLPIMLYNYPGRSGAHMDEEFLDAVKDTPAICAIKESSGDIDRIHLIVQDHPNLQLSCGADDQALEFFAWGAGSWVCGAANCVLEECIALYNACVLDGDFATGRKIMLALLPVMSVLERGGRYMQCVKYACSLQGLPVGPVRKPLQDMDDALKEQMKAAWQTARDQVAAILAAKEAAAA